MFSDPTVKVLGDPDLFINAGSFINLTCTGENLPGTPEDVYWYHQDQVGHRTDILFLNEYSALD